MENIIYTFLAHPLFYIGSIFAFLAAIGFLVYLRGFIGGIGNVFTMTGNIEHVAEANARAVWGLCIITYVFVIWELVRFVAGWF
ncbi:hypothetical protein H7X87_02145 [Acetobacteraceae bacterium]|nr:hypothetical protein [Candidatus Parcubacteria bacterium]